MPFTRLISNVGLPSNSEWTALAQNYRQTIHDPAGDSKYLRQRGLIPNVLDFIRGVEFSNALDVGCGDGWLFDIIQPKQGCECDITVQPSPDRRWPYVESNVIDLQLPNNKFDLIVASLLLMWVEDLASACEELYRVAADNSVLVVAVMHPASYRMGHVDEVGQFVVERNYSEERVLPELYIAGKVGPFHYFHRPLSSYLNALSSAGWQIRKMQEWSIDMTDYRKHFGCDEEGKPARTDKLPMYAFLQCTKSRQL